MKNVIELNIVHARIEETRQALALAEGKEREVLEVLMDSLYETEDLLLDSLWESV